MNWLRHKKSLVDLSKGEAAQAAKEAQHRLTESRARWPEVQALVDRLIDIREKNHLAEAIREAIVGGDK